MARPLVTVFGGSGFVGRHLIRRLAKQGFRVRAAVRRPNLALFLRPMGDVGQVEPMQANIRDEASVAAAVRGADYVVNLVGILHESGDQQFAAVQSSGAERIARAAAAAGVKRLVQVSAIGADPESASLYARSKAAGEENVRAAFPGATILRPSIIFGPEDGFFNRFASLATLLPALPLFGGGETRFQPVYVGDVADAIVNALASPAAEGKTYELGGPRTYSFKELMARVLEWTGRSRLLLPLPWAVAEIQGAILGLLPSPMLTSDQVTLLKSDNVVSAGKPGLNDLCVTPTPVEAVVPEYLKRYRKTGLFEPKNA